ncbi:MAG: heavy metal translocating P-type ATPase [Microbacteriaceae bacterium]|nr:heavy metal translocating P-type ATPase [Microbacteriaceae bacterium]
MSSTHVDLALEGMTCATCAGRIEGALATVPGVTATVNFATERAAIDIDGVTDATELIAAITKVGYGARVIDRNERETEPPVDPVLTARVVVSLVLAVPVLLVSMFPALQFDGFQWLAAALTTPVVTWAAWPFHRATIRNARHGATTMDTLVSLGVTVAYLWSMYALFFTMAGVIGMRMEMPLFGYAPHALYFESAAVVTAFVLLGRLLETRSKRAAKRSLTALLNTAAKSAALLVDGREVSVPAGAVQTGDHVVVLPGGIVPTDGTVVDGTSAIDSSAVTGESIPVPVGPGSKLIGGTINAGGRLVIRATAVGAATELARLTRMVEEAQAGKAPVQKLVDRISRVFVPLVIALAVSGGILWFVATLDLTRSISVAVTTLVIACPCALGLATPMALLVGTGRGARSGIIIRGTDVLESTRRVTTIILDKTGTLTSGHPTVVDVAADGVSPDTVVASAARVEMGTDHPLARAVVAEATTRGLMAETASDVIVEPGRGVTGMLGSQRVRAGSLDWFVESGTQIPSTLADFASAWTAAGRSLVAVAHEDRVVGIIAVSDVVKPSAIEAIRAQLFARALAGASGDSRAVAELVAREVGITEVHAPLSPSEKRELITKLQSTGDVVAMVGDGINDAAALAQADLGIAMGHGTDVAIESSDIVIVSRDLRRVSDAIRLSRATLGTIRGNLVWAFGYNALAIPIALAGVMGPAIAGIAMALSSVFVVANSARLSAFRMS